MAGNLIEAGVYAGTITGGVYSASKEKGTPQMVLTIALAGTTMTRNVYWYCSDAAYPYTEERLKSVDFNGSFEHPAFTAKELEWECKHEPYNGVPKERWDLAGRTGGTPKPVSADQASLMSARWKANNAPSAPAPSSAPRPATAAGGPPARPAPLPAPSRPANAIHANGAIVDKATAWDDVQRTYSDVKAETLSSVWFSTIDLIAKETSKTEDQFGPAEWRKVCAGIPPF